MNVFIFHKITQNRFTAIKVDGDFKCMSVKVLIKNNMSHLSYIKFLSELSNIYIYIFRVIKKVHKSLNEQVMQDIPYAGNLVIN